MKATICLLVFFSTLASVALAFSQLAGSLTLAVAWVSFAIAIGFSIATYFSLRSKNIALGSLNLLDRILSFAFILFMFRQFVWVFFLKDGTYTTLNVSNFGDLPLHLTYVNVILKGAHFWPVNPIFPYEKLHYPFGVDLITAVFVKLGMPLLNVLPLMGMTGTICTLVALLNWSGGFAVGSFLFSGGLAGYEFFSSHVLKDYQASLAWKNIALTLFIPQRGFLFAFPIGLILLWSWRQRFLEKNKNASSLPWFVEGLLFGTLAFLHLHSFLFLSVIFAIWAICTKNIRKAMPVLFVALAPATLEVLFITGFFKQGSLIWIEPGWMIKNTNIFWFFILNYGFFVPLIFYTFYLAFKAKERPNLFLLVPAIAIYIVLLFVMFAPWDWDNTKLMVWCYLLILPAINDLVLRKINPQMRFVCFVVLFFSGFVSLLSSYAPNNNGYEVAKQSEVDTVCQAMKDFDPSSVVATAQSFSHPVSLCGQPCVAGYEGHLWSYGIHSGEVTADLRKLMEGDPDWKHISEKLKVAYVYWGEREDKAYPASSLPMLLAKKKIFESSWGKIFKIKD